MLKSPDCNWKMCERNGGKDASIIFFAISIGLFNSTRLRWLDILFSCTLSNNDIVTKDRRTDIMEILLGLAADGER